ncbi:histidine kinase [Streptomyces sp. KL116D]|uniref:histidine kinase n=1 Tax=Streptomyces sp. KL116D TaxID=3045152 RepID=UPI0035592E76
MPVLAATSTVSLVELVTGEPRAPVVMSAVVALYTVAATTDRPTTWRVGLGSMAVLTGVAMFVGPLPWYSQENLGIFAWTGMAAAAGDAVRSRRCLRRRHPGARRAGRAHPRGEARRRVAEERLRIARDLHDVVAHTSPWSACRPGSPPTIMDKRPDQAKEALSHVREASRSALNELGRPSACCGRPATRRRPPSRPPAWTASTTSSTPSRHAGLPVEVALRRGAPALPAAVDLAAFRVVQER